MKKTFVYFICSLIVLISCSKEKEIQTDTAKPDTSGTTSGAIQENGTLLFSDIFWNISESEGSLNEEIIPTRKNNIFVDSLGNLHLRVSKENNFFYGAEIVADTLFDLGEFTFFIDSDLQKLPKNAKLRLRLINPYENIRQNLVETGFIFSYENADIKSPIKHYAINTNSKDIEKHYSNGIIAGDKSKHKIVIVKEAISFLSFKDDDSLLDEYTISKYSSNKRKNKNSASELTFFAPSTKQKLVISLYCCDSREKMEEFEVVISKITTKSIFSNTSNSNITSK